MSLKGKRILLIDDDETLIKLLRRALEVSGCLVDECKGIKEAIQILNVKKFDLIFLDLNMPEYNGFTFLMFRKKNKALSAIPVIVLSGTKNSDDFQKALALGANQFLEKPFETRIILQKLKFLFLRKEKDSYRFNEENAPKLEGLINAQIVEHSIEQLKIESQIRFCNEKSVKIISSEFIEQGGSVIVCKVNQQVVDLKDGLFRTLFNPIGLDSSLKKNFESWSRKLSQ